MSEIRCSCISSQNTKTNFEFFSAINMKTFSEINDYVVHSLWNT